MKTDLLISSLITRLMGGLRDELQQYGEMLALLDHQQESVMVRAADSVLKSVVAIQNQMGAIHTARQQREQVQRELADTARQPADAAFVVLIPALPEKYRLGVEALVRENNELLTRVQQRARQNHLLLSRSMELMQQFINALVPATQPKTYNPDGQLAPADAPRHALYEAVG